MKRVLLVFCTLLTASVAMGKRQSQEPKPAPLTLRVTTHLVQVNVIALDHGHPVGNLTRNDFKVFDNGKPQTITVFRVESNQAPSVKLPPLPPGTFANWAERAGYAAPSVTVILLDALNTPFASQAYARQQVIKFLEQLRPNDRVALYALDSRLMVLHDFTSDAAPLLEALGHYRGRDVKELHSARDAVAGSYFNPGGSDSSGSSDLEAGGMSGMGMPRPGPDSTLLGSWLSDVQVRQKDYYSLQRVKITTAALIAIANHLRGLPGRKNLIWVSGGFPMWRNLDRMLKPNGSGDGSADLQNFNSSMSRAARALNSVNLAIYPVDARGLMVDPNYSVMREHISQRITTSFQDSFATMDELASRTGGRAFYNNNDIRGSIRRVVDDSRVTYVLAYYPKDVKWNGEFRKIKVRVDRRGVRLQYRRGYAAMPEEKSPAAVGRAELAEAVVSPLDATGIGLAVQMVPDRTGNVAGQPAFLLHFEVEPQDVTFEQQGGLWNASLTLVTEEFDPRGDSLKGVSQKVQLHLKPDLYQKVLVKGMGFSERLPFPILYNAERLRVVIRDDPTGAMGSVNVPLDHGFLPAKPSFTKRIANP